MQCGAIGSANARYITLSVSSDNEFLAPFDQAFFTLISTADLDYGFPAYKTSDIQTSFVEGCEPADTIYYSPANQGWFLGDGIDDGCLPTFGLSGLANLTDAVTGSPAGSFKISCSSATATSTCECG